MDIVLWILVAALLLVGFAGLILPALPGPLFVFAGLWLGAWIGNYQQVGVKVLVVLGILTLLSFAADALGAWLGARRVKASPPALVGAMVGTFAVFLFGPPGLVLGPFIGAAIGELVVSDDWKRAGEVGAAATIGSLVAIIAKIGLCFLMVGIFLLALLL